MPGHRRPTGRKVQISKGKPYPPQWFTNAWPRSFFTYHIIAGKDDVPAVEARRKKGGVEDKLTSFLQTSEGLSFPSEADTIKRYCDKVSLKDVEDGVGEAGTRKASWIDDRNNKDLDAVDVGGNSRLCKNWLTATELLRYFKEQPRYNNGNEPDAERRLFCIADLTPEFIMSIAVTSPFNHVTVLRDAICKHVGFQPSIMVKFPSHGIPIFQIEFHLPFFALRKPPSPDNPRQSTCRKPWRKSKDILLMGEEGLELRDQELYRIYEAQVSCVVYGHDEWQWTACAFLDTEHDSGDLYDDDGIDAEIDEDPIATGLHPSKPIWRPRQYFAKTFEINIEEVSQEWHQLVYKMEVDIIAYKRAHTFTYSNASYNPRERSEEMKSSFHWTWQRVELLSEFIDLLSGTLKQWNAFISAEGGDINYFSDLHKFPSNSPECRHNCHAIQSLSAIKKTFERLQNRLQRLELLRDSLSRDFEALKLRLSLDGNDATEKASSTSKFLLWVPTPIAIAASICSMQPSFIPFSPNPVWFYITVSILISGMYILDLLTKKWTSWQKTIFLWIKEKQLGDGGHGLQSEYQNEGISSSYVRRPVDDIESLGTRASLGRSSASNNDE
ncbi:hypothetical protein OIDMADRAFT_51083 [Oidiodendron maius Zn]|uniref:Uncharacterized protein n=1 Tax=Oidiodendron maius (strain Zn) TaxID=913774 RepID=A0A0C3D1Z3_OIDMZ|nr:hypothetical protein OIDMADRAFT_51083 [Oidiodendron maius Zn]